MQNRSVRHAPNSQLTQTKNRSYFSSDSKPGEFAELLVRR
jgi:hypothetical protein